MFVSLLGLIKGLGDRDGDENWVPRVFRQELPAELIEYSELRDFKDDARISILSLSLSLLSSFFVMFVALDLVEASRLSRLM